MEKKLNVNEFTRDIIELFEDFLEEKGIEIPNDEKLEDEDASNIYGTDYGYLQSGIEEILAWYKLTDEDDLRFACDGTVTEASIEAALMDNECL